MAITIEKSFDLNEIFAFLPRIDALEEQMNNSSAIGLSSSNTSDRSSSNHIGLPYTDQEREDHRKQVLDDWLKVLENKMPPYVRRIYPGKLTSDIIESKDNIKLPYELRRWLNNYQILFNRSDSRYHLVRDFLLEYFLDAMVFRVRVSYREFISRYIEHDSASTRTRFYDILNLLKTKKLIGKFVLKEADNKSQRQCNFYKHLRSTPEDLQAAIYDYVEDARGFTPKIDPPDPPTLEDNIQSKGQVKIENFEANKILEDHKRSQHQQEILIKFIRRKFQEENCIQDNKLTWKEDACKHCWNEIQNALKNSQNESFSKLINGKYVMLNEENYFDYIPHVTECDRHSAYIANSLKYLQKHITEYADYPIGLPFNASMHLLEIKNLKLLENGGVD